MQVKEHMHAGIHATKKTHESLPSLSNQQHQVDIQRILEATSPI